MSDRFVLIGLAGPRCEWFARVSRWATEAVIPADFIKAISAEEVRARLDTGRRFSVVLLDATVKAVDRDLLDAIRAVGCAAVVVTDHRVQRDWEALGAHATLEAGFDRDELVRLLATHARSVPRVDAVDPGALTTPDDGRWQCPVISVTGAAGCGVSTVAMAVAQGLAQDARHLPVALADFALDADLAVLTDAGDVVPGVQDLVEAHRLGTPTPDTVRSLLFPIPRGGYDLLAGLREPDDWPMLRRGSTEAALAGLRHAYRVLVVDHDADLSGEAETGCRDLEDRNALARAVADVASAVAVVGRQSTQGLHRHVRITRRLLRVLHPSVVVVPVVNHAPRRTLGRADVREAFATLAEAEDRRMATPVFLGHSRGLEACLLDGAGLPRPLVDPVTDAVEPHVRRPPRRRTRADDEPGHRIGERELGHWSDDGEAA